MSKPPLRKQSLALAAASATPSTPWDTQSRPCVPDFSTYLDHAKSLCPHLIADCTPPSPPAAADNTSHSTASQLLRLTRLQAEWEERQLAAYQTQIADEHAASVSNQSLNEQHAIQQLLLSHLHSLTAAGADSPLVGHVRHAASSSAAALNGLTVEQQASVDIRSYHMWCTTVSSRPHHHSPHATRLLTPSGCAVMCCVSLSVLLCLCWQPCVVIGMCCRPQPYHCDPPSHDCRQHSNNWSAQQHSTDHDTASYVTPHMSHSPLSMSGHVFVVLQERAVATLQAGQQQSTVQFDAITSFRESVQTLQHKVHD